MVIYIYMYDVRVIKEKIKIGNGIGIEATKVGKIKAKFIQKNKEGMTAIMANVKHVPKLWCNLFSIGSAIDQGWNLGNKKKVLTLEKKENMLKFDLSLGPSQDI